MTCSLCQRESRGPRGLCGAHDIRWRRAGKPDIKKFVAAVRAGQPIGLCMRTCPECNCSYHAARGKATCSEACANARYLRQQREAKRREWQRDSDRIKARARARQQADPEHYRAVDRQRKRHKRPRCICRRCGREFAGKRKDSRFCGVSDCGTPAKSCVVCHRSFHGRGDCCGAKCRRDRWMEKSRLLSRSDTLRDDLTMASLAVAAPVAVEKYLIECAHCGDDFRAEKPHTRYCSETCRRATHADRRRRRRPPTVRSPIPCAICQRSFVPDRNNAVLCSEECRRRYNVLREQRRHELPDVRDRAKQLARLRLNVQATCIVCRRDMTDLPDLRVNRYTCSDQCRREALRRKNRRTYERRRTRDHANP